jgi:hypothetical protein
MRYWTFTYCVCSAVKDFVKQNKDSMIEELNDYIFYFRAQMR